jgi:hypothetical protein
MRKGKGSSKMLVLRTCKADLTSHNGFQWPVKGPVEAPDWNGKPVCGGGLHGLPWGEGNAWLCDLSNTAKWLVVEVDEACVLTEAHGKDLTGKCKFPRGVVVFVGGRCDAAQYIHDNGGAGRAIVGLTATAGYAGTATAGYAGTATAGDAGTATAGYAGTATAGNRGTATAGYAGTATAGNRGTATAGDAGTATAGYAGTATAGNRGTATAGYAGTIQIRRWDGARYRIVTGYIGEDGLVADKAYVLDEHGCFVEKAKVAP